MFKWQFIINNICLNRKRKAIVVRVKVHTSEKTQQLHVFDFFINFTLDEDK